MAHEDPGKAKHSQARHVSLQDLLRTVETDPAGRRVIHFHLSQLPAGRVDGKKIKSAIDFLRSSIDKQAFGDVVVTPNRDIVAWVRGMKLAGVLSLCRKIENYFCDEWEFDAKNFYGEMYFYTIIDASVELGRFRAYVVSMMDFQPDRGGSAPVEPPKQLISIENFSRIVDIVQKSDITAHIFNQPIYNISQPKTSIDFVEFYTSVKSFEDALCPQYSIAGDPWLFNRLTEEFDKAVLRHMGREIHTYRQKAFSLNLNLRSVMSKEFALFSENLGASFANRIILEINKVSMFSNWQLFEEVCALARQRAFKICIDGMDVRDFANITLQNIDFDYIKLRWSVAAMTEAVHVERAVRTLTNFDRSKVVLSMCDHANAFAFAQAAGIQHVQGHLADKHFRHKIAI